MPTVKGADWLKVRSKLASGESKLIDLRSPKEYQTGHIPFAHNIPLLDNDERHQVGLTYKTIGQLEATQMGLELFAKKSGQFLQSIESLLGDDNEVIVHCWRGGMRSRMVAAWLAAMGYEVTLLEGGYKKFRQAVLKVLDDVCQTEFLVLNGRTGSGKTDLIEYLKQQDLPVIDLEGLANHRGSVFGGFAQDAASPSQQLFENKLADEILALGKVSTILFEIENFIGPITVPQKIRKKIYLSDMVFISRDFEDRVEKLMAAYIKDWDDGDSELFIEKMEKLRKFLSRDEFDQIVQSIKNREFSKAIETLLLKRYDIVYNRGLKKHSHLVVAEFNITKQWGLAVEFLTAKLS